MSLCPDSIQKQLIGFLPEIAGEEDQEVRQDTCVPCPENFFFAVSTVCMDGQALMAASKGGACFTMVRVMQRSSHAMFIMHPVGIRTTSAPFSYRLP